MIPLPWPDGERQIHNAYQSLKRAREQSDLLKTELAESALNDLLERLLTTDETDKTE